MLNHLLHLREKLAGRVLPGKHECVNVTKPYGQLFDILAGTVTRSESAVCWLTGPAQSGKKMLLAKVIHDVQQQLSCAYKILSLAPENCHSFPAAVASLYEQLYPSPLTSAYLTTAAKMDRVLAYIKDTNVGPTIIHLQRFTRIEREQESLVLSLLDALDQLQHRAICLVASDFDMVSTGMIVHVIKRRVSHASFKI